MTGKRRSFSNVQSLTLAAMLASMSVVIGILCKNFFTFQIYYRFTLENLPVVFAGLVLGPVYGALTGATADLVSCLCSAYPVPNLLITVGAACVGLTAGLVPRYVVRRPGLRQTAAAEALGHLVGQVGVKSVAKIVMLGMPWQGIFIGLGVSIVAGTLETVLIQLVLSRLKLNTTEGSAGD